VILTKYVVINLKTTCHVSWISQKARLIEQLVGRPKKPESSKSITSRHYLCVTRLEIQCSYKRFIVICLYTVADEESELVSHIAC